MTEHKSYISSLDGLRALAVLLVIFRHWHMPNLNLEFGWIGVNLFFVLSGFLITSILLKDKTQKFWQYIKVFYLKRTFRIFPIYYLYIIACILFFGWYASDYNQHLHFETLDNAASEVHQNTISLLSYTYNFHNLLAYMDNLEDKGSKFFGHIWSLCIEEQFYIFFPVIVFFLNKKWLKFFLIAIIIGSPLLRGIGGEWLKANFAENAFQTGLIIYKTTFFQSDALATGALLALIDWRSIRIKTKWLICIAACLLFANLFTVFLLRQSGEPVSWFSLGFDLAANQATYHTGHLLLDMKYAFTFSLLNLLCVIALVICLRENFISKFLSLQPLRWIGKVSYGIYLYHNPFFEIFVVLITLAGFSAKNVSLPLEILYFALYISAVFLISYLSYLLIETPFLRMKEKIKTQ